MNPAFRFVAVAILALASAVAGVGIFGSGQADAQTVQIDPFGTSYSCAMGKGNSWTCTFKNAYGLQQVAVLSGSAAGYEEVQKESFRDCPQVVTMQVDAQILSGPFAFKFTPCPAKIDPSLTGR